jgi:acylphosphatase
MRFCAEIIIQGVVQGVGYRYYTIQEAKRLDLVGHVGNLANGDVKVIVEGERSLILTLLKNLRIGPSFSHVTNIKVDWRKAQNNFTSFSLANFS